MSDIVRFASDTLHTLGLAPTPLVAADGWSSNVLLSPTHAFRLSSGRFRDAYVHERDVLERLPTDVPHAAIVAIGHWGEREWMVQKRVPGVPLGRAWRNLDHEQRRTTIHQLGTIMRAIHRWPLPDDWTNPWLDDALMPGGKPADAYHAPPSSYQLLLNAAMRRPDADHGLLTEVAAFLAQHVDAFAGDPSVLVHCDLHFANIMWHEGAIAAVLDWEGSRRAAPDQELDTLLRFVRTPDVYVAPGESGPLTSDDVRDVPDWLGESYPEVFAHPALRTRLDVYEALWQLVGTFHFPPGSGVYDPWANLRRLLDRR